MSGIPTIEERNLRAVFERTLSVRPDQLAHLDVQRSWTFAEVYERSLRLGSGLRSVGARVQEPTLLMLDNHLDYVHTWLGLALVGVIEVPINTAYKAGFLSHIINDSGAELIVVEDHYCQRIGEVADDLQALKTIVVRGGEGADLPRGRFHVIPFGEIEAGEGTMPAPVQSWDRIAYMYTSGTTGPSKGVILTHAHAYTYALGLATMAEGDEALGPEDRMLLPFPQFHIAGQFAGVLGSLIFGTACHIPAGFSVGAFWDQVRDYGATFTALIGAMVQLIEQQPPRDDDADSPLRLVNMIPLSKEVERFEQRFGVRVCSGYGMTECGYVMTAPVGRIKGNEAGFPRDGYEFRIVDENDLDVPNGEIGELLVRPNVPWTVMEGYQGMPEKTAQTFRNLWLHTGDAMRRDDDGRYYFCDRIKDAIRRRGENVSSFEVEAVIAEHPGVLECAVIAVPSELSEDEVMAVIVPQTQAALDPAEIIDFVVPRLPYFMVPRYIEMTDELPKTPTQKVQKQKLRDIGVSPRTWDREAAGIVVNRHS